MEYIHQYKSPLGGMTASSDGEALTGLWFDGQKYFGSTLAGKEMQNLYHTQKELPVFEQADRWLDEYFSGKKPGDIPPISIKTTPFRKAVWEILRSIPYGQTMTYKEIADRMAKQQGLSRMAAQAVGGAVGHNPISLMIPCHRVVGSRGSLTGYAGGVGRKKKLLILEGVDVSAFFLPVQGTEGEKE